MIQSELKLLFDENFFKSIVDDFNVKDFFVYDLKAKNYSYLGNFPVPSEKLFEYIESFVTEMDRIEIIQKDCIGYVNLPQYTLCYFRLVKFPDFFFMLVSENEDVNLNAIVYYVKFYLTTNL